MAIILFVFLITISRSFTNAKEIFNTTCSLSGQNPVNPFPNLKKCYKFNDASCCTILHDTHISEVTSSYIIDPCLRKYPEFEDLLCFACSPLQEKYIDSVNKKFKICQDFAMKIWNATTVDQLNQNSTRFDNCGFLVPNDVAWKDEYPQGFFLPSTLPNFKEFINKIGIPYFDGYEVEIIDGDNTTCFTQGKSLVVNMMTNVLILLMIIA